MTMGTPSLFRMTPCTKPYLTNHYQNKWLNQGQNICMVLKIGTVASNAAFTRKIFVYGDTGSGKTELIGTAQDVPEMADVLVGSIDGGQATLASRASVLAAATRLPNEVEELGWLLAKPADKRIPELQKVRTGVLDGVSEMQKADLAAIAQLAATKKDTRNKDLNELQDYKLNKGRMERIIRFWRDINDIFLVATAWAKKKYPTDANGQEVKTVAPLSVTPDLSEGLCKTIMGYFDDVWYLEKQKNSETRILYTGDFKGIFAKTRDRAVAAEMTTEKDGVKYPFIVNPTFPDIMARYKRAYKLS